MDSPIPIPEGKLFLALKECELGSATPIRKGTYIRFLYKLTTKSNLIYKVRIEYRDYYKKRDSSKDHIKDVNGLYFNAALWKDYLRGIKENN